MIRFEVWDPNGILERRIFDDEKKASLYKSRVEKIHGRVFRMDKKFEDTPKTQLVPPEYIPVVLNLLPGDYITSKKGILMHSSMTGKTYLTKKVEVMPNGGFCALDEKVEIKC
jgi:hypothetical protein